MNTNKLIRALEKENSTLKQLVTAKVRDRHIITVRQEYDDVVGEEKERYNEIIRRGSKMLKKMSNEPASESFDIYCKVDNIVRRAKDNVQELSDAYKPFKAKRKKK